MPIDKGDETAANWMKEAQKGYIRIGVLILLSKKPSHGYEIMKEIKARTSGFWTPTAGGVYPVLRDLEKAGYVKGEWHKQNKRRIKTYKITEKGTTILKNAVIKQNEIANNINALFQELARDVLNIESTAVSMPVMPNFFAAFLEEETRKTNKIREMEHQRQHIKQGIDMWKEKLNLIDKKLEEERAKAKKKV